LKPGFGRVFFCIWRGKSAISRADDVYGPHEGAYNNCSDTEHAAAHLTSVKAALTFLQSFVGARQHTVVATTQHAAAGNQTYL
jgi:hypothetical protein